VAPAAVVSEVQKAPAIDKDAVTAAQMRQEKHATAPMTKAPAPAYVAEAPRLSDWVRPEFDFTGKGSAGGHAAASAATAPATKPEMPQ